MAVSSCLHSIYNASSLIVLLTFTMVLTKSVQNKYLIGGEGINNYSLKGIVQLKMTYPQVNSNAWLQKNWNIPVESYG